MRPGISIIPSLFVSFMAWVPPLSTSTQQINKAERIKHQSPGLTLWELLCTNTACLAVLWAVVTYPVTLVYPSWLLRPSHPPGLHIICSEVCHPPRANCRTRGLLAALSHPPPGTHLETAAYLFKVTPPLLPTQTCGRPCVVMSSVWACPCSCCS